MKLITVTSFLFLHLCGTSTSVLGTNPVMTQTSMDVGNIISFVIPESPDTNINVDQLTADFRRQLERIRKQSHASKLEHGLVTLKSALPEMSREEKKKTIPIIRRVLQETRNSKSVKSEQHKEIPTNQSKKNSSQNSRRHTASSTPGKKESGYHKGAGTRPKQPAKNKHRKKPKSPPTRRVTPPQNQKNDNFNWKEGTDKDRQENPVQFQKNPNFNWQNDMNKEPGDNPTMESQKSEGFSWQNNMNNERPENPVESQKSDEVNWQNNMKPDRREYLMRLPTNPESSWQRDVNKERIYTMESTGKPLSIGERSQHYGKETWDSQAKNEEPRKQPPQFSCSEVNTETTNLEYKVRNPKEVNEFEVSKDAANDTPHINNDENYSNPPTYPVNVEIDDFKGFERILQGPEETLNSFNSTTENEQQMKNREDDQTENAQKKMPSEYSEDRQVNSSDDFRSSPNYYELSREFEVNRQTVPEQVEYPSDSQMTRRLVNFGDENMEIRIQRSVDDNSVYKKNMKLRLLKNSENKSTKLKKPWKSYPHLWHKTPSKSSKRNADV